MLHVLDVRDAMDSERFQQVQFDPVSDPKKITHSSSTMLAAPAEDTAKEQGLCVMCVVYVWYVCGICVVHLRCCAVLHIPFTTTLTQA